MFLKNLIPLLFIFGFHHILSDTYTMDRKYLRRPITFGNSITGARLLLQSILYVILLSDHPGFELIPVNALLIIISICYLFFFGTLFFHKKKLKKQYFWITFCLR